MVLLMSKTKLKSVSWRNNPLKDVDCPSGPLFHPCCGDDTFIPIVLFLNKISEFHFVDTNRIIRLPKPSCITDEHKSPSERSPELSSNVGEIPKNRISSTSYSMDFSPSWTIGGRKPINKLGFGSINPVTKIHEDIWELTDSRQKINIFRYRQDGALIFLKMDEIAVFYYTHDSYGEGGSNQWWLGPALFNLVLDKLMDGGIIVTDGSNFQEGMEDVEWRNLRRICRHAPKSDLTGSADFTYRNRNFKNLTSWNDRESIVSAWKVTKS
jgi:hypothetical protein